MTKLAASIVRIEMRAGECSAHGVDRARRWAERILVRIELDETGLSRARGRWWRSGRVLAHAASGFGNEIEKSAHAGRIIIRRVCGLGRRSWSQTSSARFPSA